jgi:hypothetical protein
VLFKIMVFVVALLSVLVVACDAADSTWKTHQDQDCGIEVKYPPSYVLEASGPRDACKTLIAIGVRDAQMLRALFSFEIREMESLAGPPLSARGFALQVAMA